MNLSDIKNAVKNLSIAQMRELYEFISQEHNNTSLNTHIQEARFSNGLFCPKCGCTENIQKFGKRNGIQRYRCKDCGRVFLATTETIFEGTKKSFAAWEKYIECMRLGLSVRKSAEACGIATSTAFVWRHKILDALTAKREKDVVLKGVIEADETYFRTSYKGSRNLPEGHKPRKRGTKASKRGLSKYQICIPCAIDRSGSAIAKVCNLGKISTKEMIAFYAGKVKKDAIFCTDSEKSYQGFAAHNGFKLIQIESGKHKKGVYHINHINAFHNNLKNFSFGFRGMSTKYLNNYLTWYNVLSMGERTMLTEAVKVNMTETYSELSKRPAIPLMFEAA